MNVSNGMEKPAFGLFRFPFVLVAGPGILLVGGFGFLAAVAVGLCGLQRPEEVPQIIIHHDLNRHFRSGSQRARPVQQPLNGQGFTTISDPSFFVWFVWFAVTFSFSLALSCAPSGSKPPPEYGDLCIKKSEIDTGPAPIQNSMKTEIPNPQFVGAFMNWHGPLAGSGLTSQGKGRRMNYEG